MALTTECTVLCAVASTFQDLPPLCMHCKGWSIVHSHSTKAVHRSSNSCGCVWTLGCFLLEEPASQYELDQLPICLGAQVHITLVQEPTYNYPYNLFMR